MKLQLEPLSVTCRKRQSLGSLCPFGPGTSLLYLLIVVITFKTIQTDRDLIVETQNSGPIQRARAHLAAASMAFAAAPTASTAPTTLAPCGAIGCLPPTMPIAELTALDKPANETVCKYPFVPITDRIREDPYDGGRRKIPRYLHLAWVSNDGRGRCMHYLQAHAVEEWKKALPNYSVFFHADNAVAKILQQENWPEFPHLSMMMKCAQMRGAMLIDVWRQLILYKYGGIYVDMDVYPSKKFEEELISSKADFFSFSDFVNRPSQWAFGMSPGHPVGYQTMLEILQRLTKMDDISFPRLVFLTGPDALKDGYRRVFNGQMSEGYHPGSFNTTARKIGGKNGGEYIIKDVQNVADLMKNGTKDGKTLRKAIKEDTGSEHWKEEQKKLKNSVPSMTCADYLYMTLEVQTNRGYLPPPRPQLV